MKPTHFVVLAATAAAGVAALLYTLMVGQAPGNDPIISLPGSALAAFIVAALCWGWLVARRPRPTLRRGALVGLLIGVVAHPVAFLFTILISLALNGPNEEGLLQNLLTAPVFALLMSGLSLATVGVITGAAGAMGGALLAYLQPRLVRAP